LVVILVRCSLKEIGEIFPKFSRHRLSSLFVSRAKREVSLSPRTTSVPSAVLVSRAKKRSFLIEILLCETGREKGLTICGRR
jgi:hypothetical protein